LAALLGGFNRPVCVCVDDRRLAPEKLAALYLFLTPRGSRVAEIRDFCGLSVEREERARKLAIGWLCSAANCSPMVKFPDHWENRGNFVNVGPSRMLGPRTTTDWRWNSLMN
jgi:hypothetical protein